MQSIFTLNPNATRLELHDEIYSRFQKTKAVLTCIMFAIQFVRDEVELDNGTLYNALWAVDDQLFDLERLYKQFESNNLN